MENLVKKDINLDKIINEMYQKHGKEGLTEFEMARYLYLELGKLFRYDMNYPTYYDRKKEDIYYNQVDYDNIENNAYTCVQMSDIYVEALKRVGIKANTQRDVKAQTDYIMAHKYTVIKFSDGRNIIADLIYDLPFIQLGMKTSYFGTNSELGNKDTLTEEEIKCADDKINYTYGEQGDKYYTETFIEMIKQELNNPQIMKEYVSAVYGEEYRENNLIKYKLDLISKFLNLHDKGFYEGARILACIYSDFFSEDERKRLSFALYRKEPYENHKVGNVEEIICYCFKKDKNECEYYVYEEGKDLENIEREEVKRKIKTFSRINDKNLNESEYGDDIFTK